MEILAFGESRKKIALTIVLLSGLSAVVSAYAILIASLDDFRVQIVLSVIPVILGIFFFGNAAPRWFLALLIFSLPFSARFRLSGTEFRGGGAELAIAPFDFPLLGLCLAWFLEIATHHWKLKVPFHSVFLAFVLLFLTYLPSLFVALDKNYVVWEIVRLVKMGILMLVIQHYVHDEQTLSFVISLLFMTVIIQGILAVAQSLFGSSFGLGFLGERDTFWVITMAGVSFGRAGGTMGHANALAHFFELTLPLGIAVYLGLTRGTWLRLLALIALGAGSLGLFLTFSRGGWGAFLIGMITVASLIFRFQKKNRARVLFYLILLSIFLCILVFIFRSDIGQRITSGAEGAWKFRTNTYRIAWNMIKTHPLLGVGVNNYVSLAGKFYEPGMGRRAIVTITPVHNLILLIASEMGIVGLFGFLSLLVAITLCTLRLARSSNRLIQLASIGIFGGIVSLMAHQMLGWLFRYDPVYTLFWFQLGFLIAFQTIETRLCSSHYDIRCSLISG